METLDIEARVSSSLDLASRLSSNHDCGSAVPSSRVSNSGIVIGAPTISNDLHVRERVTAPVRHSMDMPVLRHYRHLPGWLLLAQFFLAAGWLRAASEKMLDSEWWLGQSVRTFLTDDPAASLSIYQPLVDHVLLPAAPAVAVIVLVAQFAIGVGLAFNVRTVGALVGSIALNINFMLAGAVNPSIFYVVIASVILLWRLEHMASASTRARVVRRTAAMAAIVVLTMTPMIRTLDPKHAIEDPALVIVFFAILATGATWWAARNDTA